jgi:starvation-inducible DNA-binding protein
MMDMSLTKAHNQTVAVAKVPTGVSATAVSEISVSLNLILADMFALFFKTKNFHWHMTGPHFHDYHLLLDEQSAQIFAVTDPIAERVRKLGGTTLRSMVHAVRLQRTADNDSDYVAPRDMLVELLDDNRELVAQLRDTHALCGSHGDVASASLIENWIDEAEGRAWYLAEAIA